MLWNINVRIVLFYYIQNLELNHWQIFKKKNDWKLNQFFTIPCLLSLNKKKLLIVNSLFDEENCRIRLDSWAKLP